MPKTQALNDNATSQDVCIRLTSQQCSNEDYHPQSQTIIVHHICGCTYEPRKTTRVDICILVQKPAGQKIIFVPPPPHKRFGIFMFETIIRCKHNNTLAAPLHSHKTTAVTNQISLVENSFSVCIFSEKCLLEYLNITYCYNL